jgi:hypothetical protein
MMIDIWAKIRDKESKSLTCARLEAWHGMVDLISKGVDMAGAEIQLTHANVVMMVLVGVHGVSRSMVKVC